MFPVSFFLTTISLFVLVVNGRWRRYDGQQWTATCASIRRRYDAADVSQSNGAYESSAGSMKKLNAVCIRFCLLMFCFLSKRFRSLLEKIRPKIKRGVFL